MNTLGCHTPPFYGASFMPYVAQIRCVDICHYMVPTKEDYHDVFSPDFANLCEHKACRGAAANGRPLPARLLDDRLSDLHQSRCCAQDRERVRIATARPAVVAGSAAQPGCDRTGKQAYAALARERYRDDIGRFNKVYDTSFASFDDLLHAKDWRPSEDNQNAREVEDDLQFLYRIVDLCYEVEVAAIRKFDTNHLTLGDKLNGNSNTPDQIVRLAVSTTSACGPLPGPPCPDHPRYWSRPGDRRCPRATSRSLPAPFFRPARISGTGTASLRRFCPR